MVAATVELPGMGKNKNATPAPDEPGKRRPGRPPQGGRTPAYLLNTRLKPEFEDMIDEYIRKSKPEVTIKAIVEAALLDFFAASGIYPPGKKE